MIKPENMFTDPAPCSKPPEIIELKIMSGGLPMNAIMMTPAGDGPHPAVAIFHGFPGNERNLFLAEALRMAGCCVLFFHYRGAWGSPGGFSLVNVLEDASAAIDYLKSGEAAKRFSVDSGKVFAVGQSMGGFAAILTAARRSDLAGAVAIAPFDFAAMYKFAASTPDKTAELTAGIDAEPAPLVYERPCAVRLDLEANWEDWLFVNQTERLAGKQLMVLGFKQDKDSVPAMHFEPIKAAYLGDNFTLLQMEGDHSYSGQKMAVCKAVGSWIAERCL